MLFYIISNENVTIFKRLQISEFIRCKSFQHTL